MSMKKLLIISNLYPLPWEPNRATFNRQQFELLKDNYQVRIAVPVAWPEYLKHRDEIEQNDKVTYFPNFYTPGLGRRFYPKMMELSFRLFSGSCLKDFVPDKILSCWAFPEGVAGQKLAERLGIPFYLKVHGSDINGHGNIPERAKQIVNAANKSNGILSVSNALKDKMITMGIDADKINVIYNGVDKTQFKPNASEMRNNTLFYVGNLKDTKGVMELLKAFHLVSAEYPELKLTYAGSGHMRTPMNAYIEENGLVDRVKFLGTVNHNELPALMKLARFVVLPSYAEGVPNVLLESMSCGTPVVATAVGGIPEVVQEGMNGYLSEPRSATEFAETLRKALNHDWDYNAIASHAEQFDWNRNKAQLLDLLSQ